MKTCKGCEKYIDYNLDSDVDYEKGVNIDFDIDYCEECNEIEEA